MEVQILFVSKWLGVVILWVLFKSFHGGPAQACRDTSKSFPCELHPYVSWDEGSRLLRNQRIHTRVLQGNGQGEGQRCWHQRQRELVWGQRWPQCRGALAPPESTPGTSCSYPSAAAAAAAAATTTADQVGCASGQEAGCCQQGCCFGNRFPGSNAHCGGSGAGFSTPHGCCQCCRRLPRSFLCCRGESRCPV